jgi:hypothetical protein
MALKEHSNSLKTYLWLVSIKINRICWWSADVDGLLQVLNNSTDPQTSILATAPAELLPSV